MPMHASRARRHHITTPVRPRERGVAMLLVIVLLFATTVLAGAALTSRSNSGQIGINAVDNTSAEWAAESGARVTQAILDSAADWIDLTSGDVLTDFAIAGADVTVKVTDMEGEAPDDEDTMLLVTVTARVGEVEVVSQKVMAVRGDSPDDPAEVLDEELNEFALYGTGAIGIEASAQVYSWANSPDHVTERRVNIGLGNDSAGALVLGSAGAVKDGALFVNPTASGALADVVEASFGAGAVLPLEVPVIPESVPADLASLPEAHDENVTLDDSGRTYQARGGAYRDVQVQDECEFQLSESAGGRFSFEKLCIKQDAVLSIHGAVRIYVEKELEVKDGGAIVFGDRDASLEIYVGERLLMDDAAIGCNKAIARNRSGRKVGDVTWYMSPGRIKIISVSDPDDSKDWEIKGNSVVLGMIRAPRNRVAVTESSHVIGRLTAWMIALGSNCSLAYDKSLDRGAGLTNTRGMLYDADTDQPAEGLAAAIAAYRASGTDQRMGRFVRSWLQDHGYPDCFAPCDAPSGSGVTLVEALSPVIDIESHGASGEAAGQGNGKSARTLTIVAVTEAPTEAAEEGRVVEDLLGVVAETADETVTTVTKTATEVVDNVLGTASTVLGGKR